MNNISQAASYSASAAQLPKRPLAPKQEPIPRAAQQPVQNTGAPRADSGSKINYLA